MRTRFGCAQITPEIWTLQFDDPMFKTPSCWEELRQMSLQHGRILVIGLFDWSNYSHAVVNDIIDNRDAFEKSHVGLAAFCPSSQYQIKLICPDLLPYLSRANTEPFMFVVDRGLLTKVRFGPMDSMSILNWILSGKEEGEKKRGRGAP